MLFKTLSIFGINNSSFRYLENSLILSKTWRVKNFTYSLFTFSFPEIQSCGAGMCKNMATYRFLRVNMSHCISWISHNLICHKHCNIKLFSKFQESTEYFSKQLLPFSQLASSTKVTSKYSHDRVNNQERMWAFHHECCCIIEERNQMLNCITSCVFDVLKSLLTIKTKPFSNLFNSLRSECTFCINVNDFTISSSFLSWKLGGHA